MQTHEYNNVIRKRMADGSIKEYVYVKKYEVKNKVSKRSVVEKINTLQDYDKLVRINQVIDDILKE